MCFPTCMYTRDDMKHLAADKECCTQSFKAEEEDGKSFIISCFYMAVLLPVQSSMHELEGPNVGLMHRPGGRDPQPLQDEAILSTCVHPSHHASTSVFPITALQRHRLPRGFIAVELNTVRHAMLTLHCFHYPVAQYETILYKAWSLWDTLKFLSLAP